MRKQIVTAANIAVFAALLFIALEMTIRVYLFGITGLNPVKVNSFRNIVDSELVQASEYPEVWYELKPKQNTIFRGAPFRTNSHGLADDEYTYDKAPDTFRVAVIGSSWTMGAGVDVDNTFHSVLEKELNQESDAIRYEFINFGVEFYGLGEMIGTIKHKALRYDPDMILFIVTGVTPLIPWEIHEQPFEPSPASENGWTSYVGLKLTNILGLKEKRPDRRNNTAEESDNKDRGQYSRQLQRAFDELAAISAATNIPVATAWLRINESNDDNSNLADVYIRRAERSHITGAVVDLDKYLQPGEPIHTLLVSRSEKHPNDFGHTIIAIDLREKLFPDVVPAIQSP